MKNEIGKGYADLLERWLWYVGGATRMVGGAIRSAFQRPFPTKQVLKQLESAGVDSLSIIFLTGLFTGMVLAIQGAVTLERFGATSLIGNAITASLLKELGPVLAALMVAGRVGAGYASELGTMVVTEQVNALRAMGTDPRQYLVLPRMIALIVMLPLLTIYANAVGLFGGFLICVYSLDLTPLYYLRTITESMEAIDVFGGLLKAFVFGFLISAISCHVGLSTRGGSEAVGRVTKVSVVISSIFVLGSDFFITRFLFLID